MLPKIKIVYLFSLLKARFYGIAQFSTFKDKKQFINITVAPSAKLQHCGEVISNWSNKMLHCPSLSNKIKLALKPRLLQLCAGLIFGGALVFIPNTELKADSPNAADLFFFSGNSQLRDAIWRLAAFVPGDAGRGEERKLEINNVKGLPPVSITLFFNEPLDIWPESIELRFLAEESKPPQYFILNDKRPFGGSNLKLSGSVPLDSISRQNINAATVELNILKNLNTRLLNTLPKISSLIWHKEKGLESAKVKLLYGARFGTNELFLLRLDPNKFLFRPYHESDFPNSAPGNISAWSERLSQAVAIVNGGQYYPDRSYMGALKRAGEYLFPNRHKAWKGFVVSGVNSSAPPNAPAAAIIDLDENERNIKPEHYQNYMQSFMLLDARGSIRVRNSRNLAGRTALGEDKDGRMVLIMTPAAVSLHDFAIVLKSPSLRLKRVLSFDGGFEAQMLLNKKYGGFTSAGHFSISDGRAVYIPAFMVSLPSVLAVEAVEEQLESTSAITLQKQSATAH